MLLDRSQRGWAFASLLIFAASAVVYVLYSASTPLGPRGGSPIGLFFGILGFAFMIFAALLGARKRVPVWRIGRAQAWMRGHLWLGLLTLPLILFHGGFHFGGALTQVLMWLLIITVLSGACGAVLQNYLPRLITADVPLETIYAEIGNVRKLLCEEADHAVELLCGPLGLANKNTEDAQRAGGFTAVRAVSGSGAAVAAAAEVVLLTDEESAPLRRFYLNDMRPFLEQPADRKLVLSDAGRAQLAFSAVRTLLPAAAHDTLDDLQDICDEARQLRKQESFHRWLHGWLLVHIPLSLALILLGVIHAVMALRF